MRFQPLRVFLEFAFPLAVLACVALLFLPDREGDKSALMVGVLAFSVPPVFSALANPGYSNTTNTILASRGSVPCVSLCSERRS